MVIPEILNLYGSPEETEAVENLCLQVGRVTYHWNILHHTFRTIFALLIGEKHGDRVNLSPGRQLWDAQKTATGQRALLRVCAEAKLNSDPEFQAALAWALSETAALESWRHAACEMVFSTPGETIKLNPVSAAAARLSRLRHSGQANLFRCLIYDLNLLDHFATKMLARMIVPWHWKDDPNLALANRPALLTAPLVEKSSRPE